MTTNPRPEGFFGYTIYKNPSDAPGMYVLRGWSVENGETLFAPAVATPISDAALAAMRKAMIEHGMICVGRQPEDDPVIVESWI